MLRDTQVGLLGLDRVPGDVPSLPSGRAVAVGLTSGSTGEPNATVKSWGELVARSRAAAECFGLAGQTVIGTVPPHHMYGFETTVLLPLHAPVASWFGPAFYPADIRAALLALPGPGILVTTPVHLRALFDPAHPEPWPRPPQQVISATAPLDEAFATALEEAWGTRVSEIFGATEFGSIAHRRTAGERHWTLYPGVRLSLGQPGADGDAAPTVEAPWAAPAALRDVVEPLPGGAGFMLLGRRGDVIKLGGRRASLTGLTHILNRLEGVTDGVFLAPDDLETRPNARLVALAVAPGREPRALLDALRREIDPVFVPRRLILCSALPRNATGKLPRAALLDLAARAEAGAARAAGETGGEALLIADGDAAG